jgi:hypothetical protein
MKNRKIKFRCVDSNSNYNYFGLGENVPDGIIEQFEQFTGCYDRDGKEIWEGDQLDAEDAAYTEIVFFEQGCFGVKSIIDSFIPMTDLNLSMYFLISKNKNL